VSQLQYKNPAPCTRHRLIALAVASACAAMIAPAMAQENPQSPTTDLSQPQAAAPAQTVVVTGIRASMQSTLNLKRNSDGIVDGIVADDIGKFPDTNLAEAVQRISGVSIDRSNGEGQRVTVRGVGPNFNLVLLNGRQMPSANISDSASRSFDFSNIASEAVSQIQVYKSARADTPAGGIGATLNIMTGRPLDLGNQTSVGGKLVYDRSNINLPGQLKGKNITPEVSTLISRKFGTDDMFGIGLTASYQARNSGFAQAVIPNGYLGPYAGATDKAGTLIDGRNINGLAPGQLYDTPQNLSYVLQGTQRKRTNAQLTFQFRPFKDWTNTIDYTYVQNKQSVLANQLNVWFSGSKFVNGVNFQSGAVASPTSYTEDYTGNAQDFDMKSQNFGSVTTLKSIGFNTQYRVNSGLKLSLDAHHSTSDAGPNGQYGSNNDITSASFGRDLNTLDLTQEMPVLSMNYTPQPFQVSGSQFGSQTVKQTVDQVQASGSLKIGESSNLNLGLGSVKTKFDSAFQNVGNNAWSGTVKDRSKAGQFYNQANYSPIDYRQYFSKLGGSNDPKLFPTMYIANFTGILEDAKKFTAVDTPDVNHAGQASYAGVWGPSLANPDTIRTLQEKTNSAFAQYNTEWDTAMPMHTGIGIRYEKTKIDTTSTIAYPISVSWGTQNEYQVTKAPGVKVPESADYHFWLPAVDWDMDVTSNLKLRASYGVSIGRPQWDQIQGGTTSGTGANIRGLSGNTGNPGLRPVKSKNLDLSAEWYYSKQSMVSLGLYNKDLTGFPGSTIINTPSTTATTPVNGKYWQAASTTGGCGADTFCIRDYIFTHFAGQPGVTATGPQPDGHQGGAILGIPGDPGLPLLLTTTVNANKANAKGAEVNWQHMFDNGFGFQANYTYVRSGLHFDNAALSTANGVTQFALIGLSNSANLVGIYENETTSVRLAYNWRGEFLNSTNAFDKAQPGYTEPYGQVDLSVGYNLTKNLALSFEAINLTNATQRQHGRNSNEVLSAIQFGPRFMLGARYKF
jgi:TonB-dependent receptor